MKIKRIFLFVFVLCLLAFPASALAAPALQDATPPLIDWGNILEQILVVVLPLLAGALVTQGIVIARYYWEKLKAERPDIVLMIDKAAQFVVPIIEQLKKNGTIPDNDTAKQQALELMIRYLTARGFDPAKVEMYFWLIDKAIEGAVNDLNSQKLVMTGELVSSDPPLAG